MSCSNTQERRCVISSNTSPRYETPSPTSCLLLLLLCIDRGCVTTRCERRSPHAMSKMCLSTSGSPTSALGPLKGWLGTLAPPRKTKIVKPLSLLVSGSYTPGIVGRRLQPKKSIYVPVLSSDKRLGNHIPRTGYDPTTPG
jgi:hypothetical protein